ncbi:MAG: hypothetical protein P1P72_04385 [ANME-2 cluster archaeon]|nr:hypothetical protein [ANME-2 cluster archaeon]
MKSRNRDILLALISIVLAFVIKPFIMILVEPVVKIVIILALAYIFYIVLKQLIK